MSESIIILASRFHPPSKILLDAVIWICSKGSTLVVLDKQLAPMEAAVKVAAGQ
jgi:hypothetical protein